MSEKPEQTRRGWTIVASTFIAPLAFYVSGYFALSDYYYYPGGAYRLFSNAYVADLYEPVGAIEARCRGTALAFAVANDIHPTAFKIVKLFRDG